MLRITHSNSEGGIGNTKKVVFLTAVAVLILGLFISSAARADSVYIDESAEGVPPTVQVFDAAGNDITSSRVTIVQDIPEYIEFTLSTNNVGINQIVWRDLFEDFIGGILSDRFWLLNPNDENIVLVKFWSDGADPALFPTPDPNYSNTHFPDLVESGTFQRMASVVNTNVGNDEYIIYAKSDAPVPEPATMLLLGSGLIGLAGYGRKKFFKK